MNWVGRKVVVTGADGFIGSHLVEELLRRGSRVVAVVRRTSRSQADLRFRNLTPDVVAQLADLVQVDLAGPSAVDAMRRAGGEVVFHLAADAYVPASFDQPAAVVQTNVMSTLHVLEAARAQPPAHLLITSSSEVYGSHDTPITEHHPLLATTPYAASKAACDRLAASYHTTFHLPLTIVRPFNSFGPRHVYDVVPLFAARALRGDPLVVNGDGLQRRDLTYVDDTVAAFIALAELEPCGEAFNIGTGVSHTVNDIAQMVVECAGSGSAVEHGTPRAGEVQRLEADASRLRNATGWAPTRDLRYGVERSLDWMRTASAAG